MVGGLVGYSPVSPRVQMRVHCVKCPRSGTRCPRTVLAARLAGLQVRKREGLYRRKRSAGGMMRYWLTTHWPPREDEVDDTEAGIWVPEGRERAATELAPGDSVVIYESRTGRAEIRTQTDGSEVRIRCKTGRQGVVLVGRAKSRVHALADSRPAQYTNGTEIWWRWHAPADDQGAETGPD